jgi:hypothetical protein
MRKLPSDAFSFYLGLGHRRSYKEVAQHYGASKRAVVDAAAREQWPERLARIELEAREKADRDHAESLAEVRRRHLQTVRAMNARALAALREFPLASGMDAIRAAEVTIKLERMLLDEATERVHLDVAAVTRRELDELLTEGDRHGGDDNEQQPSTDAQ